MSCKLKKWGMVLPLALALNTRLEATQIVEHADRSHQEVHISASEQNLLSIEGRKIAHVVPSRKGVVSFLKDEVRGALYFALAKTFPSTGTLTFFVADDQGAIYKLILIPRPMAGEEIILRPSQSVTQDLAKAQPGAYLTAIRHLLLTMARGLRGEGEVIQVNKRLPLWREASLLLLSQYPQADFIGEHYRLTNISEKAMRLAEQEFYRFGVLAVAMDRHSLAPGESTDIFMVRSASRS